PALPRSPCRPRVRPPGLRRLAASARDRSHRPVLPAPGEPERPDRGDRRRDGRTGRRVQGTPPRTVRSQRGDDPPRPPGASDHRGAERVVTVDPGYRERGGVDLPGTRYRVGAVLAAGSWDAHRAVPLDAGLPGARLPPVRP